MTYIQQRKLELLESRTSTKIHKALAGRLKPSNIEIINNLKKEGKKYVN
jgi:hypothetical protein